MEEKQKTAISFISRKLALEEFNKERLVYLKEVIVRITNDRVQLPMDIINEYNEIVINQEYDEAHKETIKRMNIE